ncbi:MAG: MAPEG family protein [Burkholderiaceae bacterium]|jgi:uncharacterized MAPEG superfamily protein
MTTALWCLFITMFFPIVCAGISKAGGERYDNAQPRQWLAKQEGFRGRAVAAQQNSWEALLLFAIAIVVAHVILGPTDSVNQMAVGFVVARLAYIFAYVANWAMVRTLVWLVGFLLTISIFAAAS